MFYAKLFCIRLVDLFIKLYAVDCISFCTKTILAMFFCIVLCYNFWQRMLSVRLSIAVFDYSQMAIVWYWFRSRM